MAFDSVTETKRSPFKPVASIKPAKPEKCRKETRRRLKALKRPKAREGFFLHPDAIERAWLEAKCSACGACSMFA